VLTELVSPESEHVLDWFHITMRVTVLEQYARGVAHHDEASGQRLLDSLESIKWLLWHGNQYRSREEIHCLFMSIALWLALHRGADLLLGFLTHLVSRRTTTRHASP
jgi:hypothetical protein